MGKNILLFMSLSGSAVFLLYLLLTPIGERQPSAFWNSVVLKLSLFFFLVPFPLAKYYVSERIFRFFPANGAFQTAIPVRFDLQFNGHGELVWISQHTWLIWYLAVLFGIPAFLSVLRQLTAYFSTIHGVHSTAEELMSGPLFDAVQREKDALALRRRVRVFYAREGQSPMAFGVFFPAVLLPEGSYLHENGFSDVLRHELLHIKRHDLLFKFMGLLVVSIHWFNPLCRLFNSKLCDVIELCCDAETMRGKSEEARKTYCTLLIEFASECNATDRLLPACRLIGNDAKTITERILALKHPSSKPKKLLSCAVGTAIVLSGLLTSLAYQSPVIMEAENGTFSERGVFTAGAVAEVPPLPFECYFTDEEGTIYQVTDGTQSSKAFCRHKFVSGTITEHIKSSDGSCKTKTYDADRCSLCGYVIRGDLITDTFSAHCPH